MRVSDYAKQTVPARAFWTLVLITAALLVGAGLYQTETGHFPAIPGWFIRVQVACLVTGWIGLRYGLLRRGPGVPAGRFFPFLLFLVGYTLFVGDTLVPSLHAAGWASAIGSLLMGLYSLSLVVDFRKRPAPEPRQ